MIRKLIPIVLGVGFIYALWLLPVWDQGVVAVSPDATPTVAPTSQMPPGHPPVSDLPPTASEMTASPDGSGAPAGGPVDLAALSLPATGLGSEQELEHALPTLPDDAAKRLFEESFRLSFATEKAFRDYVRAKAGFEKVLELVPDHAPAVRGLAYAEFNTTMNFERTIELYERAVELDDDYGEAHYALSFMLGSMDPEQGRVHFDRALELGIEDERGLRGRFYGSN